jgi:integrase/recombinase XerD
VIFEAGLRLGETLGLMLQDFCVWENKIKIVARDHLKNGVRVKNEAEGELLIPEYTMKLFCKYISEEFEDIDSDYVFVNLKGRNRGEPMKPITVQKLFERLSKAAGIKVHPHMLRHSHATELIEKGHWDALDVKERLRHRQIQTTINKYVHLSDQYKKEQYKIYQEKIDKRDNNENH